MQAVLPLLGALTLTACEAAMPPEFVAADGTSRGPDATLASCEPTARAAEAAALLGVRGARPRIGRLGPLAGQLVVPGVRAEAHDTALASCMADQGFEPRPFTPSAGSP